MKSTALTHRTSTGLIIYNMIEDDVKAITEDQSNANAEKNSRLGIANQVTYF